MKAMVKLYCDRCGKESEKLHEIKIPTQKREHHSFDTKPYQVCVDCESEYDDIIDKLTDIRFVLFDGFMRKEDEGEMNKNELYDLEIEVHKKVDIIKNEQAEYVRGVEKGIDLMFDAVRTFLRKEAEQDHPTEKGGVE